MYKERRRREIVRVLMANKVRSAEVELEDTRQQFHRMDGYLRRRWFHHREAMTRYNIILQNEVEREWKEKRMKDTEKINHLERKWMRIRREEMRGGTRRDGNLLEGKPVRGDPLQRCRLEEESRRGGKRCKRARSTTGVRWDQSNNPRGCNNDTSPKVCYI